MSRRRSTVHDAAALRLHPNGVRVNDLVQDVRRSAKTPTHAQRTSRGNWIATDAGGRGRVTKRRKVSTGQSKDLNVGEAFAAEGEDDADAGQLEEIPVKTYKDARARRRVAFENDLSFLSVPSSIPVRDTSHLQPSSDFLKCIHHFASQYYDSRGQLFDGASQNRYLKKQKRLREHQATASRSQDPNDSQNDGKDEEHARSGSSNEVLPISQAKPKVKKGKSSRTSEQSNKDMYKAFDGSALLCIGTLLQSYICSSLADNVPDAWADNEDASMSEESHEDADSGSGEMHSEQFDEDRSGQANVNRTKAEATGVSNSMDTASPSSEG